MGGFMSIIIGRTEELNSLDKLYQIKQAKLLAVYGRRRVGKSYLLEQWSKKSKNVIFFEGLKNVDKKVQVANMQKKIKENSNLKSLASLKDYSWPAIFDLLTLCIEEKSKKEKLIIVFDEFQWLCSGRSELVSLFKMYWDQKWKNQNVMIILCGSIASFMVNKVIKSKALYGRIDLEMHIRPFEIQVCAQMLKPIRSHRELLTYFYVFGGNPSLFKTS